MGLWRLKGAVRQSEQQTSIFTISYLFLLVWLHEFSLLFIIWFVYELHRFLIDFSPDLSCCKRCIWISYLFCSLLIFQAKDRILGLQCHYQKHHRFLNLDYFLLNYVVVDWLVEIWSSANRFCLDAPSIVLFLFFLIVVPIFKAGPHYLILQFILSFAVLIHVSSL